jgi:hypothetical protein
VPCLAVRSDALQAKPGSGDGKIVANSGQMARLGEGTAYSPLNSGRDSSNKKRLAPQLAPSNPSPERLFFSQHLFSNMDADCR